MNFNIEIKEVIHHSSLNQSLQVRDLSILVINKKIKDVVLYFPMREFIELSTRVQILPILATI